MPTLDIKCLISGRETGGSIAVFEETVEPGAGPPRHIHRQQLEIFHVITGTIQFEIDGERSEVAAGGAAVVPAGKIHAFRNSGEKPALIHFELIPAGDSEEAFEKLAAVEVADMPAFFERYGMDLVGPPLGSDARTR